MSCTAPRAPTRWARRLTWKHTMSEQKKKPNNLKTGLILGGVALFFFVMVFVKRIWLS